MTLKSILSLLLIFMILFSCKRSPLDVDVSEINVNVSFLNLDSIFVHSDSAQQLKYHHEHLKNIRDIYEYELGYCLGIRDLSDTTFSRSIQLFLADPYIARVEKRIEEKFSELHTFKEEIISGFKHLRYHFPSGKIPENIVFMNSLFTSNAFSTEKQIGIGLERYLGKETDVIQELPPDQFFEWIKEGMDAQFLSRDALCSWIMTHYVEETEGNLAENIIRWGKIIYLTQAAFPKSDPALMLRYSEDEYKWALENEYSLWKYLVDEKMLFKINDLNKSNLLNDAPFTIGLPEKGPDRLGQFLGFRMILKYMEIKDITVEQLIQTPYTEILVEYEID